LIYVIYTDIAYYIKAHMYSLTTPYLSRLTNY